MCEVNACVCTLMGACECACVVIIFKLNMMNCIIKSTFIEGMFWVKVLLKLA